MMKLVVIVACWIIAVTLAQKRFRVNEGIIDYHGRFPFMVRLFAERISSQGLYFSTVCGGSLISDEFVLTAAHCVNGDPLKILMYFGANDTDKDSEPQRVELRSPPENIISYGYIFPLRKHDIALVKLPQKINFTNEIQPVRLPGRSQTNLDYTPGVITGWGAVGSKHSHSNIVRYGVLTIVPDSDCLRNYKKYFHPSNICIDGSYYTACHGDSGGPALIQESDRAFTQVGIASTQIDCEKGYPSSYTRVTSYLDWIHRHTRIPIRN